MPYVYRPMLRTKAGEAIALAHLDASAAQRIDPIFHVTASLPVTFARRMGSAWAGLPMALDGHYNFAATGSTNDLQQAFNDLGAAGVAVRPSIELYSAGPYLQTVQLLAGQSNGRLVVKSPLRQLANARGWVSANGWRESDVDLVVEVGHLGEIGVSPLDSVVMQTLANAMHSPVPWRSVSLAASAAPKDMGVLNAGRNAIPRLDWQLWQSVHGHVTPPVRETLVCAYAAIGWLSSWSRLNWAGER